MKKTIFAAAALVGSVIATGALAQVDVYNMSATAAVPGTSGSWNVKLYKLNGTSGNAATQFLIKAARSGGSANDHVTKIQVEFFSYLGAPGPGTIPLVNGAGGILGKSGLTNITSSIPAGPDNSQLWTNTNVKFNGSTILANKAQFESPLPATRYLKQGGSNQFLQTGTGSINLKYRAYSVKVTLFNAAGTKIWSAVQDVSGVNAPEGSSLALLAAGLVPLGLVARRRLRSRG